jgi:diguanylate cyclase
MATRSEEHERTMAFAEIALGQIKALGLPAGPRNYEIWYAYATGYYPELNQAINDSLRRSGTLSAAELDQIHDTYLSPTRLTDRIGGIGARAVDQIDEVMAILRTTLGSAGSYHESLADATLRLGKTKDGESLRQIVESLITTAKEMENSNQTLASQLNASKQQIDQLQQTLEGWRYENLTDPLTSLASRQYFDQALQRTAAEANRTAKPLSVLKADIDHFKKFNEAFGHVTGDQVLRLVARAVKQNIKGADLAARYGGQEFAVMLPNTALRQAKIVAEHIRRAVMTNELRKRSTGEHLGRVTVSIGVASYRQRESTEALIDRAAVSLQAAKGNGRNQVMDETESSLTSLADSVVG